jgi:hypothetical protein
VPSACWKSSRPKSDAAGTLEFRGSLHLGIAADEIAGHHLIAECFGRRLDQEGDGELPLQDPLLVGAGQSVVRQ